MKRSLLILAGLIVGGLSASAYARVYTMDHSCSELKNVVQTYGAVVLYTGPYTYDRYVSHGGYCEWGEQPSAAWVPSRDNDSCWVGYTCRRHDGGR
jgi:hypothetical protein